MVSRQNAVRVTINPLMVRRARRFAILSVKDTYDRFSYQNSQRIEKIVTGKLGEEILRSYFISNNLKVEEIDYRIYPGTTSIDKSDLIVKNKYIDVKVGTKDFHKRLLIVKQYFDNQHKSDFYVAINLYFRMTIGVIYGYATKEDISMAKTGKFDRKNPVLDYFIFYDNLLPIENLTSILQKL
jgi:hypothetical protein